MLTNCKRHYFSNLSFRVGSILVCNGYFSQ